MEHAVPYKPLAIARFPLTDVSPDIFFITTSNKTAVSSINLRVKLLTNLQGSSGDEETELRSEEPDGLGQGRVLVLDAMGLVDQQVAPPEEVNHETKQSKASTKQNNTDTLRQDETIQ